MKDLFYLVASIGILVFVGAFAMLVRGALRELTKIGQASEELSALAKTANEELVPVTRTAACTLGDVDRLIVKATETVDKVDNVASGVETLLDVSDAAVAAKKAVRSSAAELISVYEGVKQGIKTLRGS